MQRLDLFEDRWTLDRHFRPFYRQTHPNCHLHSIVAVNYFVEECIDCIVRLKRLDLFAATAGRNLKREKTIINHIPFVTCAFILHRKINYISYLAFVLL